MTAKISCASLFVSLLSMLFLACDSAEDKSAADLAIPVVVEKVKRGPIASYVSATGTLRAQREERVVAEVEGVLRMAKNNGTVLVAGARVQAGQHLAEIENQEYLLNVRVESQKLAMENASRELQKQEALFKEGGVTEKELELARRNALDARLNYEAAQIKVDKLRLKAPISGFIANLQSNAEGTRVPVGFRLCSIMDYNTTVAQVNLPNTDLERVQIGQEVVVSNYAIADQTFRGRVTAIDPTIDPQTRTFTVTIEAANEKFLLRPGMFVKADIVIDNHANAVIIPKTALQTRDNRPVAFVVEGASAALREVSTGIETREEVEILEGLAEGERLVVKGHETLRDKSKVRVTE
ncbi:efflux RND transporter periplasmic adaptor subunit [candidate division KSB1 bacterium]|nr:efflux RND transporter periplasmic adaptor subunit [candidate division KSB1 bacterium]